MSPSKVETRMKPLAQGNGNHSMDQVNRSYSQGPEGAIGQHKKLCYSKVKGRRHKGDNIMHYLNSPIKKQLGLCANTPEVVGGRSCVLG